MNQGCGQTIGGLKHLKVGGEHLWALTGRGGEGGSELGRQRCWATCDGDLFICQTYTDFQTSEPALQTNQP